MLSDIYAVSIFIFIFLFLFQPSGIKLSSLAIIMAGSAKSTGEFEI
jgi:hypothetical protein